MGAVASRAVVHGPAFRTDFQINAVCELKRAFAPSATGVGSPIVYENFLPDYSTVLRQCTPSLGAHVHDRRRRLPESVQEDAGVRCLRADRHRRARTEHRAWSYCPRSFTEAVG